MISGIFICPQYKYDLDKSFYGEELIQVQIGTTNDIFLECERDKKMVFHHFKRKRLELISLFIVQYNGLDFAKNCIFVDSWLGNLLHAIMHLVKTQLKRHGEINCDFWLNSYFIWGSQVTFGLELLEWFIFYLSKRGLNSILRKISNYFIWGL